MKVTIAMETQNPPAELVDLHARLKIEYAVAMDFALRNGATPNEADRHAMRVTEALKTSYDALVKAWAATRSPPRMLVLKDEP